jgi:hypothetical protein
MNRSDFFEIQPVEMQGNGIDLPGKKGNDH